MSKESDQLARRLLASPAGQAIKQMFKLQQKNAERPLGEIEYIVPVSYSPFPSFDELEMEFGEGNISDLLDGCEFQKHPSCMDINETPGDRIFLVKCFNRKIETEEAIAEMDKVGYRPATHLEAHAFQKANPELQRQFWIIALGSSAVCNDQIRYVVLRSDDIRRIFGTWIEEEWPSVDRFLFVRR